jgi:hypothetical protein
VPATKKGDQKMSENEDQMLNPQVAEVEIGIRNMRKIKVYPLSMADQLKLTDTISKALAEQFAVSPNSDMAVIAFITKLVQENLGKILSMVTDEDGDSIMTEITNLQAASIAEIVYETNYGVVSKNFKSLLGKLGILFPSGRQLPPSVNDMDTGLTTSTESPGETEE